jgi:hypothetical protein
MPTSSDIKLIVTLLEKSLLDVKSHLGLPLDDKNLAFYPAKAESIAEKFCQQLPSDSERYSEGDCYSSSRRIFGWRMDLWQAALSYLVLKNSPLIRTNGLTDYTPHLALFVAMNCYGLIGDDLDKDALAKATESIGRFETRFYDLTDYAVWLKAALQIH